VRTDKLVAIASPHEGQQVFDRAAMLAHHELVARLHADNAACLPARFPTLLQGAESLRALLERKAAELEAALERVRGRSELAVTVLWTEAREPEPLPAAIAPGRRYLLERQRAAGERAAANALAEEVERCVGDELVEARRRVLPRAGTAVSLALLVSTARAAQIREQILNTGPGHGVRILVNGPWAAYSFVTLPVKEE
jgi:gas vesicle protein GvpL/GvpF